MSKCFLFEPSNAKWGAPSSWSFRPISAWWRRTLFHNPMRSCRLSRARGTLSCAVKNFIAESLIASIYNNKSVSQWTRNKCQLDDISSMLRVHGSFRSILDPTKVLNLHWILSKKPINIFFGIQHLRSFRSFWYSHFKAVRQQNRKDRAVIISTYWTSKMHTGKSGAQEFTAP